jgi:Fe-S-cluster containining protein
MIRNEEDLMDEWRKAEKRAIYESNKITLRLRKRKSKQLDVLADKVHEEVFTEINCLNCANCCKSIPPIVSSADAQRIAKSLGMKKADFSAKYLLRDEDGDTVMNASPCPFLLPDNHCEIYEDRPKACRAYPHTNDWQFTKNIGLHAVNSKYCPAVFHILKRLDENGRRVK